ncbi:MAG: 1-deoxy-D-xylulose-5-phosphate reductoisomerase [Candidatus Omnitrophica bacterium]|nr:1-deoxy-D-xylulose-5-phosphate reductoisomerase [Candidatus Omnitrophota bacterium]
MKDLVILGSTGSVGQNALKVVEAMNGRFRVVGLACNRNIARLIQQVRRFRVRRVAVRDPQAAHGLTRVRDLGPLKVYSGPDAAAELVRDTPSDRVLSSVVGAEGLIPIIEAIRKGLAIAIANKEPLVMAGELISRLARRYGSRIYPVDSEHSAIFQCLNGSAGTRDVRRLILTGTGGPFLRTSKQGLNRVLPRDAIRHPKWNMGKKISVDSSTLMNKGLEIIEAQWLFHVPSERIEVVIHPEAVIHSMVEFVDGSILAQLGITDMRIPIQYALTHPDRFPSRLPRLDLARIRTFSFEKPDLNRFPCLRLAREAAREGKTMPAVLNAANEVAVEAFLKHKISLPRIARVIEQVMSRHRAVPALELKTILETDGWAREEAFRLVN